MEIIKYSLDITPPFEVTLSGFGQVRKTDKIHNQLEMNFILFLNNCDSPTILISVDTLFITNKFYEDIFDIFKYQFPKLNKNDLIVSASHTHYAPSLEDTRTDLGCFDNLYYNFLLKKIKENVHQILSSQKISIELKIGVDNTNNLNCNRRRKIIDYRRGLRSLIVLEPNENGSTNNEIYVIKVVDLLNQKPIAVIWSFACHPTNLPDKSIISSEFVGIVRNHLRKEIIKDLNLPVLFLQGFAGDVRAVPPPRRNNLKYIFYKLIKKSYPESMYRFNWDEYNNWTNEICKSIEGLFHNHNKFKLVDTNISTKMNEYNISNIGIEVENIETITVRQVKLSENLLILFLSAEVLSEYKKIVDKVWPEKIVIPAGYIDNIFGYLPSENAIIEGGYESIGFFKPFKVKGKFIKNIETKISECLIQSK